MKSRRDKFVIAELMSNSDGKTSGSGFIGVLIGIIGCIGFVVAIIGYIIDLPNTVEVMRQTTLFIGASTILLGARKISSRFGGGIGDYGYAQEDSHDYDCDKNGDVDDKNEYRTDINSGTDVRTDADSGSAKAV